MDAFQAVLKRAAEQSAETMVGDNLEGNVLPKLEKLREFGFYPLPEETAAPDPESCGAHSPRTTAPVAVD